MQVVEGKHYAFVIVLESSLSCISNLVTPPSPPSPPSPPIPTTRKKAPISCTVEL